TGTGRRSDARRAGQCLSLPRLNWILRGRALIGQPAFRRGFAVGFASASVFPPAIGSSISRWPSTLAFDFFGPAALAGLPSSFAVSACTAARLLRTLASENGRYRKRVAPI